MKNFIRTFIGIDVPEEVREEIQRCQIGIPTAKWTKKENLHITLEFLGEIPKETFEEIEEKLSHVKMPKFKIRLLQPNVFFKKQKILWLKVQPAEPLAALRNEILKSIEVHHKGNKQQFLPHLTIARMDTVHQRKLDEYLLAFEDFTTNEFEVNSFVLFSSILQPQGPVYTREREYTLF